MKPLKERIIDVLKGSDLLSSTLPEDIGYSNAADTIANIVDMGGLRKDIYELEAENERLKAERDEAVKTVGYIQRNA